MWFGAGTLSRTILAFLIAFFPMVINTILGVRGLHPDIRNYADSLVCGRWQLFAKVEFPSSLTSIFAGMKISATLSVIGVVVAEIVAGRSGLGYLLLFASAAWTWSFHWRYWSFSRYGAVHCSPQLYLLNGELCSGATDTA